MLVIEKTVDALHLLAAAIMSLSELPRPNVQRFKIDFQGSNLRILVECIFPLSIVKVSRIQVHNGRRKITIVLSIMH